MEKTLTLTLKTASSSSSPLASTNSCRRRKGRGTSRLSGDVDQENAHPNIHDQEPPPTPPFLNKANSTDSDDDGSLQHSPTDHASSVKVVVRIRPVNRREREGVRIVQKLSSHALSIEDHRTYSFDYVLGPDSSQEDIFNLVGVPLVKDALAGFNTSILSYGQTGSGKTYTMWGPPSAMLDCHSINSYQGLVPRIFHMLFSDIQNKQANYDEKKINYQFRCSFLEIYNEQINDLLDPTQRNLQIGNDAQNGFHVENLTDEYVNTVEDVTHILVKGLSNRKVGATSMNSKSSRSHIIFTCTIESWCKGSSSKCFGSSKTSRISLVDLAGCDREKPDGVGRQSIKEEKYLKQSLSKLGKVVNILAENAYSGKDRKIPYMDSCLTHLLQETLGGNSKITFVCSISPNDRHRAGTLSTLRFGERAKLMKNTAVINEITEDHVNGLSDQIRQLKEELIREKSFGRNSIEMDGTYFKGKHARDSLNLLRVSLNRSLILPYIDNDSEEELDVDEDDVMDLCSQLSNLTSFTEKSKDIKESENSLSILASKESSNANVENARESHLDRSKDRLSDSSSLGGSILDNVHSLISDTEAPNPDTALTSLTNTCPVDHDGLDSATKGLPQDSPRKSDTETPNPGTALTSLTNTCLDHDGLDSATKGLPQDSPRKSSHSTVPCLQLPLLQEPTICLSPKIDNLKRSIITSLNISADDENASGCPLNLEKEYTRKYDPVRSSLQSNKICPTESLAASLHRGLQIIDYHQQSSAAKRSPLGLSFEHLASVSCHQRMVEAGAQASPEDGVKVVHFLCSACKKENVNTSPLVNRNLEMQIVTADDVGTPESWKKDLFKDDNKVLANAIKSKIELETLCAEQAAMIRQLNCLVDQYKHESAQTPEGAQDQFPTSLSLEGSADTVMPNKELESNGKLSKENQSGMLQGKDLHEEIQNNSHDTTIFDLREREALLMEIRNLKDQLKSFTDVPTEGSLLDQIREGTPLTDYEQERQRWTESESRWISLTEELRQDLESNRRLAESKDIELNLEKKCTAELDDALQRSILGHARFIEHYAELQETYNDLLGRHRKVMEGIAEVKKAASKAGSKGAGRAFAAALAAEISTLRVERERERSFLKEQNKGLRIQLRDTAEAVHAAGELLVRLREAEEAVSLTEKRYAEAQQVNEKLRKQVERLKKKHTMEMATMKHYLADSRLPESAQEPLFHQDSASSEEIRATCRDDDQSWRAAFGPSYQ